MYESMYYEAVKNNVDILDSFANGGKLGVYEYAKPSIKYSETPFTDNIKWNYWNKIYRKERKVFVCKSYQLRKVLGHYL